MKLKPALVLMTLSLTLFIKPTAQAGGWSGGNGNYDPTTGMPADASPSVLNFAFNTTPFVPVTDPLMGPVVQGSVFPLMRQLETKLPGAGTLLLRSLDENDTEKGLRWGWADTREVGSMIGGCTPENKPSAAYANQDDGNLRFARRWFEMPAISKKFGGPETIREWRTLAVLHEMLVRAYGKPLSNCTTDLQIKKLTYMIDHIAQYRPEQLQEEFAKINIYFRTRAQAENVARLLPSACVKVPDPAGGGNRVHDAIRIQNRETASPYFTSTIERDLRGLETLGMAFDPGKDKNHLLVLLSPEADCQASINQIRSNILGFGPRFEELTQARPIENGNGVATAGGDLITRTPAHPSPDAGVPASGGADVGRVGH